MSVAVVVLGGSGRSVEIGVRVASELTRLGVTDTTLVDGLGGTALVLSGWDFDGRRHEKTVIDLLAPGGVATVMHEVADVVLCHRFAVPTSTTRRSP